MYGRAIHPLFLNDRFKKNRNMKTVDRPQGLDSLEQKNRVFGKEKEEKN